MKRCFAFLLLLVVYLQSQAQNPASIIKDSTLSLPEKTFEVFWQTFEDNYAFFKLRNIDWKSVHKNYRTKVDSTTTDDSLFSTLSEMVAPFYDDHINIIVPGVKEFTAEKPSPFLREFPEASLRDSLWKAVNGTLYKNGFATIQEIGPKYRGKRLFGYSRSKKYGYIRMGRCFVSEATYDDSQKDAELAGKILDSILQQMSDTKALIFDIRSNIGGDDEFAYAVAGRFVTKKILGHSKRTRITGTDNYTSLENWYITPLGREPYTKPLIVLTNDQTASAGDVYAMIIKSRRKTTIVGTNTLGIYSDMYGFELPNKWLVSLSNQQYFSSKGVYYEGKGTPVDIEVHNTRQDLQDKVDPVVLTALSQL
ncbi:S41 family peptidase [Sinomicrobium oceani]|uniref:S41 family peptidase n=1 Tax=Sinomicrobium oceani TaxID=1150368 RepID=UPI00227B5FDF|nr:S41 family peptidase [Sinomicrobium oceani]